MSAYSDVCACVFVSPTSSTADGGQKYLKIIEISARMKLQSFESSSELYMGPIDQEIFLRSKFLASIIINNNNLYGPSAATV